VVPDSAGEAGLRVVPGSWDVRGGYPGVGSVLYSGWDDCHGTTEKEGCVMTAIEDEREALARVIHADDVNHERAHQDFWLMNEETVGWYFDNADAVLAAGFRRQGPITDAQVEAAARRMYLSVMSYGGRPSWSKTTGQVRNQYREEARAALEAARDA
jgi:FAD/FMN-containing dehydrogenase